MPSGPASRSQVSSPKRGCSTVTRARSGRLQARPLRPGVPRPGVAEPQVRQHVERRRVRAGVGDAHLHEEVVRVVLGVRHLDHPVAVVLEHPGVEQLVLGSALVTPTVLGDEVVVRELRLRVVVAPPQPGVAGQGVGEPPVLLDVLAVVALGAGQPEHPLLEDRVAAVPQGQRQAELLADVADAGHPVLAPAVGAGAGVVVGEVVPRLAAGAVVLAHGAPRALGEIGTPLVPGRRLLQTVLGMAERLHSRAFRTRHRTSKHPGPGWSATAVRLQAVALTALVAAGPADEVAEEPESTLATGFRGRLLCSVP